MSKSLDVSRGTIRYADLSEYVRKTGKRKQFVARVELDIDPPRFTELLNPDMYRPRVDEVLAKRIAALLNQPVSHVRKIYRVAA